MKEQLAFWNTPSAHAPAPAPYDKAPRRTLTLKELPEAERPISRLQQLGPGALSTTELLAILLGNPHQLHDASSLLATYEDLVGVARAPLNELQQQPGIGVTTAARIKAALELGTRLTLERNHPAQVRSPADAANLLLPEMGLLEQEQLRVILLDTKNQVVAVPTIYVGSVNTTMIRISELFREAIRRQCPSIIICHNHPSGDPTPSPEDVAVTRQAVEAGKLLDIDLLDHVVLAGPNRWVSLKERGLGF
jgi:DNA repair protein RadC